MSRAIVRRLAAKLQSPSELARPFAIRKRLISTLFGRASTVFTVAFAAIICGGAAWMREGHIASVGIAAAEVCLLIARCSVIIAYKKRATSGAISSPDAWLVGFGVLAIGSSISWGALCFVGLTTSQDPLFYLIPILSTVGTAGALAARNSGVPRLAKMQLACSLTPICAGCWSLQNHGFRLLELLIPALAVGLLILINERNQQLVDLIETQAELERLSQTDPLTQLPNRRFLDTAIQAASAHGFALLMIDVDHFKAFNDRRGHLMGDVILRNIAAILQQTLRVSDGIVARYGGEEFAVLINRADAIDPIFVGERLRRAVLSNCCDPHDGTPVTISVGCAISQPGQESCRALEEADMALYKAKRNGRNRIEVGNMRCSESVAA